METRLQLFHPDVIHHPVSHIDENHLLYGNFIGVQYVLKAALDSQRLSKAISELIKLFPALSGRLDQKHRRITPRQKPLYLDVKQINGSALDYAEIGKIQKDRSLFLHEATRNDVFKGVAPLSSFRLTKFEDRSAIFGMAISHVLVDAGRVSSSREAAV